MESYSTRLRPRIQRKTRANRQVDYSKIWCGHSWRCAVCCGLSTSFAVCWHSASQFCSWDISKTNHSYPTTLLGCNHQLAFSRISPQRLYLVYKYCPSQSFWLKMAPRRRETQNRKSQEFIPIKTRRSARLENRFTDATLLQQEPLEVSVYNRLQK